jgi:prolyl-tRNA synthetase
MGIPIAEFQARIVREKRERKKEKVRNFIEWFNKIIMDAELYEYRYPVKGAYIWRPYGLQIRRRVENIIRELHDGTGHGEVLFPVFIPLEYFSKESEHIRGFEEEVFWVSKGGKDPERLILRPTSETAMMPMFKLWIKDHTDLPLKVYQITSVFRAETKSTHPMIRLREISMFKEAHTAHVDREDAEKTVREAMEIYKKIYDYLSIPYLISRRPEWDKFAGAVYTIAFDTLMPDGKTIQIGTVHYLGTNFSKVFEVTYLDKDGATKYVHTTSYGISERVIASMLAIHGDDNGLLLPPNVAPIQAVIVPIPQEGYDTKGEAAKVEAELRGAGVRALADLRDDKTPGWKFNDWEMRGVPIRVEIGPRDMDKKTTVVARRDTGEKYEVPRQYVVDFIRKLMVEVGDNMRREAWSNLRKSIHYVSSIQEALDKLGAGVIMIPWSGDEQCGIKIQEQLDASILGVPIDEEPTAQIGGEKDLACPEKNANYWVRVSRRY